MCCFHIRLLIVSLYSINIHLWWMPFIPLTHQHNSQCACALISYNILHAHIINNQHNCMITKHEQVTMGPWATSISHVHPTKNHNRMSRTVLSTALCHYHWILLEIYRYPEHLHSFLVRQATHNDVWCMMYDVWCMMYDVWCMMYDVCVCMCALRWVPGVCANQKMHAI